MMEEYETCRDYKTIFYHSQKFQTYNFMPIPVVFISGSLNEENQVCELYIAMHVCPNMVTLSYVDKRNS